MAGADDGIFDPQHMTFDEKTEVFKGYYVPLVHKHDGFYNCTIHRTYAIVILSIDDGGDQEEATDEGGDQQGATDEGGDQQGATDEGGDQQGATDEGGDQEGPTDEGGDQEGPTDEGGDQEEATDESGDQQGATDEGGDQQGATDEGGDQEGPTDEAGDQEGPTDEGGDQEEATDERADQQGATDEGGDQEEATDETFCVTNISAKHAELIIIERLKERLEGALTERPPSTTTQVRVKIYQNYSPCNQKGCCDALVKFKAEQERQKVKVNMEVIFANLYNVNRPGCVASKCRHLGCAVNPVVNTKNQDGLKDLKKAKILLRTFTKADWKFVAKVLFRGNPEEEDGIECKEIDEPKRDDEDERMRKDLEVIVGDQEGQ